MVDDIVKNTELMPNSWILLMYPLSAKKIINTFVMHINNLVSFG